jgi:uridine kinase
MITAIGRTKVLVDDVNLETKADSAKLFKACDDRYEKKVREIVKHIVNNPARSRIIMLSGPSASGKTTTSLKLKQGLEEQGFKAITISMDDFFKGRYEVPPEPDGSRDFESINALDLELLKTDLSDLIFKGRSELPIFDFKLGSRSSQTRDVELDEGSVAIVEGLHALDSAVTDRIPQDYLLKLYVSVSSDFVDSEGAGVLSARDVRLIRRTIRDFNFRGSSPENTLDMWESVCRGEDMYIRPFKKFADITVNSLFNCEPCLFKETALKLFATVPESSEHYKKAKSIVECISKFEDMPMDIAPANCLLREFTGGSVYYNKSAGKK